MKFWQVNQCVVTIQKCHSNYGKRCILLMLPIMKYIKSSFPNDNFDLLLGIFEYYDVKKNPSAMFHGTLLWSVMFHGTLCYPWFNKKTALISLQIVEIHYLENAHFFKKLLYMYVVITICPALRWIRIVRSF